MKFRRIAEKLGVRAERATLIMEELNDIKSIEGKLNDATRFEQCERDFAMMIVGYSICKALWKKQLISDARRGIEKAKLLEKKAELLRSMYCYKAK
jgi:hypothetical protein